MTARRKVQILLLAVVLAMGLLILRWVTGAQWQHITVGYDTTRVLGPLRPDGTVDYIAAINEKYGKGVTHENNAAIPLQALFDFRDMPDAYVQSIAAALDAPELATTRPAETVFERFTAFRKRRFSPAAEPSDQEEWDKELGAVSKAPWDNRDHPEIAAWLEANRGVLAQVDVATRRPRYFLPTLRRNEATTVFGAQIGSLGFYNSIAEAIAARAMQSIHAGDTPAAARDAATILRLGYLVGQQPTIMERLIAFAIIQRGLKVEAAVLANGRITPAEAATMQEHLGALGPLPSMVECLDVHERFVCLDQVTLIARFGPDAPTSAGDPIPGPPGPLSFGLWPVHFDPALRNTNVWMDRMVAAGSIPQFSAREAALQKVSEDVHVYGESLTGTSSQTALYKLSILTVDSDFRNQLRIEANARQMMELVEDGLNARIYFSTHEPTVAEVGQWVGHLPPDIFAGNPLKMTFAGGVLALACDGPAPLPRPGLAALGFGPLTPARVDFRLDVRLRPDRPTAPG